MRQLLKTIHLFPSSPPENIFDTKIHFYVQAPPPPSAERTPDKQGDS